MNRKRITGKTLLFRSLIVLSLAFFLIIILFPLYWIAITSLKTIPETYSWPPTFFPETITFEGYIKVWTYSNFSRMFINSLVVTLSSTFLSVTLASLSAYGFSRFEFRGKKFILFLFLFTQMVPAILLLLPYFIMVSRLHLTNSYLSLIIAYTSFSLPFCTWMLKGFFDSIPVDIDEAAMMDGCKRMEVLRWVILPLALPGIAATMLFSFLVAWNHYLFAMGLTTTPDMYTLPVGIAALNGEFRVAWNELMAGALIASLPALILYLFLQKWFVRGLTAGAVKG